MSIWTEVVGIVRFSFLPTDNIATGYESSPEDIINYFGKTCTFESDEKSWDECNVPCGSEGSLQYLVNNNTVAFTGNLRSYDNDQEIIDYFKKITGEHNTRGALFSIETGMRSKRVFCHHNKKWFELTNLELSNESN